MAAGLAATVVGGGIAGLASAASLVQAGWHVTVLERAPVFGEVGAGLAITRNGMAALEALGVAGAVRAAGHPTFAAGTQDRSGRWLLRVPDTRADPGSMSWTCGIHRQRLHAVLLAAADRAELVTAAEVTAVRPGSAAGEPASVTWRSSTGAHTVESDLVVAADGIRSAVRAQLLPGERLRYSGMTSWRAVIEDTDLVDDSFAAMWGPSTEFGAVRISGTEVYWYGYFRHPAGLSFEDELGAARAHFSGWSPQVRAVVAATTRGRLMRHDVYHLPNGLPSYVHGRVVVVGDAAHALLPTMGQGANTSLEDGICVGRLIGAPLAAGARLGPELAAFDHARRPRCRQIARRSVMTARMGANRGDGWQQRVRNAALRSLPAEPVVKAGTEILRWTAP